MAVIYLGNAGAVEHEEQSLSMERRPASVYTEAAGYKKTEKFTGLWADVVAKAEAAVKGEADAWHVSVEAERQGGEFGVLTLTREKFQTGDGETEEEEPDDGGESGGTDDVGTEEAPSYTGSSTLVPVSILAFHKFKDIEEGSDELRALKAMLEGADERSTMATGEESGGTGVKRLVDMVTSEAGKKCLGYIRRGVKQVVESHTEATARWRARSNKYTAGEILASVPGMSTPAGRDWRVESVGYEKQGNKTYCTATFLLSGPGGWDKFLYDGGAQ